MTAVCARSLASRSAVPPSVHPKVENPSTDMAAAPITAPQIPGFKLGGNFMHHAPVSAPWSISREISTVGAPDNTCDHVCKEPVIADSLDRRFRQLRRSRCPVQPCPDPRRRLISPDLHAAGLRRGAAASFPYPLALLRHTP